MQQSWWFRFLTSNHVHSTKKCIGLLCLLSALNQAPLLCVWAWLGCVFCFGCFHVGAASTPMLDHWPGSVRSWLFRCFMHYIGLRPNWLVLVVSGVFCVSALHWKLVGLCLYFVFVFLSCIAGPGYSWFVGVFICVCVPMLHWIRV